LKACIAQGEALPDVILSDVCMKTPDTGAVSILRELRDAKWNTFRPLLFATSARDEDASLFVEELNASHASAWAEFIPKPEFLRTDKRRLLVTDDDFWKYYFDRAVVGWVKRQSIRDGGQALALDNLTLLSPNWQRFKLQLSDAATQACVVIRGGDARERHAVASLIHHKAGGGKFIQEICMRDESENALARFAASVFGCTLNSNIIRINQPTPGAGSIESVGNGSLFIDGFAEFPGVMTLFRDPLSRLVRDRKYRRIGDADDARGRVFTGHLLIGLDRKSRWPVPGDLNRYWEIVLPEIRTLAPADVPIIAQHALREAGCEATVEREIAAQMKADAARLTWTMIWDWAHEQKESPSAKVERRVKAAPRPTGEERRFDVFFGSERGINIRVGENPDLSLSVEPAAALLTLLSFCPEANGLVPVTAANSGLDAANERYRWIGERIAGGALSPTAQFSRAKSKLSDRLATPEWKWLKDLIPSYLPRSGRPSLAPGYEAEIVKWDLVFAKFREGAKQERNR
jgi:hypothetical protein